MDKTLSQIETLFKSNTKVKLKSIRQNANKPLISEHIHYFTENYSN